MSTAPRALGARITAAFTIAAVALMTFAGSAMAWTITDDFDGDHGLRLRNFYTQGTDVNHFVGPFVASHIISNAPSGVTEVWCVEGGAPLAGRAGNSSPASYSWGTTNNQRVAYYMWLSEHHPSWRSSNNGHAALQYALYSEAYPNVGVNTNDLGPGQRPYTTTSGIGGRIGNHADFTTGAQNMVGQLRSIGANPRNTALDLSENMNPGVPTSGTLSNIGVRDAWGNLIPGISYTVTISGPAVFDWNGAASTSYTTETSVLNNIHAWTATGNGQVTFNVEYHNANAGNTVRSGTHGTYQNVIAPPASFGPLNSQADPVSASTSFQPAGTSQVESQYVNVGDELIDTFTTAALTGDWLRPGPGQPYVPVTWTARAYYHGTTAPSGTTTNPPGSAQLVDTITVTGTQGPGQTLSANAGTATKAGYYVWVWEFRITNQPAANRDYFIGNWADRYGLPDETSFARPFQPIGTSQVENKVVSNGLRLTDTFETGLNTSGNLRANEWLTTPDGDPVPITWDVDMYYLGDSNPQAATGTLIDSTTITGTEGAGETLTVDFGDPDELGYEPGFYTFVWSMTRANQAPWTEYVAADWTDGFGLVDETLSVPAEAEAVSSIEILETAGGTFLIDHLWIGNMPADHPGFSGGHGFVADTSTIDHSLYYFELGEDVTDDNIDAADLLGSLTLPAGNAYHPSLGSLEFRVPVDTNDNPVPGTYVFVTSFAGDDRVEPFTTSVTDPHEQFVVGADPIEVATLAKSESDLVWGETVEVWDEAEVTGYVPAGANIEFALYGYEDSNSPVCSPDTLITVIGPEALTGAGTHVSGSYELAVTDQYEAIGFVETTRNASGQILSTGECGDPDETFSVVENPLSVATLAMSSSDLVWGETVTVWDVAEVTGYVPAESTIEFELYGYVDAAQPGSDGDVLLATLGSVDELDGPGVYESEPIDLDITDEYEAIGFVEITRNAEGDIISTGVPGDPNETFAVTEDPITVVTRAHSDADLIEGETVTVWDEAEVSGYVPLESTIEFELYGYVDAANPACTPGGLITTLGPLSLEGTGTYESEDFELAVDDRYESIGFVEVTRDANGLILSRGECGEPDETFTVTLTGDGGGGGGTGLATTGPQGMALASAIAAALALIGAGVLKVARRRSQVQV